MAVSSVGGQTRSELATVGNGQSMSSPLGPSQRSAWYPVRSEPVRLGTFAECGALLRGNRCPSRRSAPMSQPSGHSPITRAQVAAHRTGRPNCSTESRSRARPKPRHRHLVVWDSRSAAIPGCCRSRCSCVRTAARPGMWFLHAGRSASRFEHAGALPTCRSLEVKGSTGACVSTSGRWTRRRSGSGSSGRAPRTSPISSRAASAKPRPRARPRSRR